MNIRPGIELILEYRRRQFRRKVKAAVLILGLIAAVITIAVI